MTRWCMVAVMSLPGSESPSLPRLPRGCGALNKVGTSGERSACQCQPEDECAFKKPRRYCSCSLCGWMPSPSVSSFYRRRETRDTATHTYCDKRATRSLFWPGDFHDFRLGRLMAPESFPAFSNFPRRLSGVPSVPAIAKLRILLR